MSGMENAVRGGDPVLVVREFETLMQRVPRDLAALSELLAVDVVVYEAPSLPYAGEHRGVDGFVGLVDAMARTWEFPPGVKTFEFLDAGDGQVVVLTLGRAVARATGREVEWRLSEHFRVRDGRITEIRPFYWDTAAVVAAVSGHPIS